MVPNQSGILTGTAISGTVELREGLTVLSLQPVGQNGLTTFSVALPLGSHSLTAVFLGAANAAPSTSGVVVVEVSDPGYGLVRNFSVQMPIIYQSPLLQVAPAGAVSSLASASSLRGLNNPDFPLAFQIAVAGANGCWAVPGTNPDTMATLTGLEGASTPVDIKVSNCDATNQAQWFYLEHGSLSAEGTWLYEIRPAWNITLWAQFGYFRTEKRCVKLAPNALPAPPGKHPVLSVCSAFGADASQFWSIGVGPPNVGNGKLPKFDGLDDAPMRRYSATGQLTAETKGQLIMPCSATLTVLNPKQPALPDLSKSFVSTAAHCLLPKDGVVPKDIIIKFTLSGTVRSFCALYPDIRIGRFKQNQDTEEDYAFIKVSRECDSYGTLLPGGQEAYQFAQPAKYCQNCPFKDSDLRSASFPGDVLELGQVESVRVVKETNTKFQTIAALEGGSSGGRIGTTNFIAGVLSAKDLYHSGISEIGLYDSSIKPIAGYRMVGPRFNSQRTLNLATTVASLRNSIK